MSFNGSRSTMESEYVRRHHNHEPREHQCSSTLIKHIKAPVHLVWSLVRRFDQPQKYKPFVSKCVVLGDFEVGSVREVNVKSGLPATTSTERLELLDDDEHILGIKIVGGDHRLKVGVARAAQEHRLRKQRSEKEDWSGKKTEAKMPLYDCMLLAKPSVKKEEIMNLVARLGKRIFQCNGVITDIKSFGTVQLGYGIKKLDGRHFQGHLMQMTMMVPPSFPKELQYLNKEDRLLRWLLVKHRNTVYGLEAINDDEGKDELSLFGSGSLYRKTDEDVDDDDDDDDDGDEYEQ